MEDASKGLCVEIPFDETMVRFLWKKERELEIVEVVLADPIMKDTIAKNQLLEDNLLQEKYDECSEDRSVNERNDLDYE